MTITAYPNGKFRARVRLKGKYYSDTFSTRQEAENFETRKTAEILNVASKAVFDTIQDLTFELAFKDYFSSRQFKDKAPATQKTELVKSKSLLKHFATFHVSTTTSKDVQDYFNAREQQPSYFNDNKTIRNAEIAGHTVRLEKATLSNLYKYLNAEKITFHNPMIGYKFTLKKPNTDINVIDTETLAAIQGSDYFALQNKSMFNEWYFFVQKSGMRPGEASRLLVKYYDKRLHGFNIPPDSTKNRKAHFVNIPKVQQEDIRKFVDAAKSIGSPYVFYSINRSKEFIPFNYAHAWRQVRNEIKAKGVVKFHSLKPHQLRHTFVTDIVKYGGFATLEAMTITGHRTHASILHYTHLNAHQYADRIDAVMNRTEAELLEDFNELSLKQVQSQQAAKTK